MYFIVCEKKLAKNLLKEVNSSAKIFNSNSKNEAILQFFREARIEDYSQIINYVAIPVVINQCRNYQEENNLEVNFGVSDYKSDFIKVPEFVRGDNNSSRVKSF